MATYQTKVNASNTVVGVRITGVEETLKALKAFEPALLKELNKTIRANLRKVAGAASGRYPGNYRTSARTTSTRKHTAGGSVFAAVGPMQNRNDWSSPATRAVIFEFAKQGKTPQAQAAIASYESRFGSPGRFLWDAWDSGIGKQVTGDITDAVRDTEAELQRRLDAAGETY